MAMMGFPGAYCQGTLYTILISPKCVLILVVHFSHQLKVQGYDNHVTKHIQEYKGYVLKTNNQFVLVARDVLV